MKMIYNKPFSKMNTITAISLLSAISTILFFISGLPLIISFPHLKIDLSDIPALIGAIIISPKAGLSIEFIKNFIHLFNTHTLGFGELISFIIGSTMILSFCLSFKKFNQIYNFKLSAIISYIICVITTTTIALITNLLLYPLFLKIVSANQITKNVMITYLTSVLVINFLKISISVCTTILLIKHKNPQTK